MKPFQNFRFAFLFLLLTLWANNSFSQSFTLSGKITDEENRQPLAFVNVVVNEGLTGSTSDIDGKYSITSNEPIQSVRFSSIGYETKVVVLQAGQKKCNVTLTPVVFELGEVVIGAGENPAHRIIDSVMAHRKQNNPNRLGSYSYTIYDKMVFTIDSTKFNSIKNEKTENLSNLLAFDSILKKNDLMVMETVSEVAFKSPNQKKQTVIANRVAGMKDPMLIYLVNNYQSVSFYDETVNVAGMRYVNPISQGSKNTYLFRLENVTAIGSDSLFVISFRPRQGSTFEGLQGIMTINSNQWAIQNVKAEPIEVKGVYTVEIQQLYEQIEGHWFPKQLNINLIFPSIAVSIDNQSVPMIAIGKSYLSDIKINPPTDNIRFSDIAVEVDPEAANRDESFWIAHRIDSLNQRTQTTYVFLDSITQGSDIFDRLLHLSNSLLTETAFPIGPINLDIGSIFNVAGQRGFHFGLGLSTNDRLSHVFSLNGYFGYWTKIRIWDFGGGIKLKLNPKRQTELAINVNHEPAPIGAFNGFQEHFATLSETDYKYVFFENTHSRQNRAEVSFSTRFAQHFKGYLTFNSTHKHYSKQFFHTLSDSLTEALFADAEVKIRFAYNEKFINTGKGIRSLGTLYPEVWLSYQHSFPNVFGSQFEYDRVKFQLSQNFYTKYIGVSKVILQAGYASEGCPVMETFDIMGSYSDIYLYSPGDFCTMRPDEFFCDRFAALYLTHNFNGMLWKPQSQWFSPELVLATNIGWGDMRRTEGHTKNFQTMEKGYFESGFIVKGLLNLPFLKLGAGAFYRYGPYAWPNYPVFESVWNNFAWKWSATFSL